MNYKIYNLTTLVLLLFFCQTNAQVTCADGNFEAFNNLSSYSFQTAVESNHNECSAIINNLVNYSLPGGFPPINTNDAVTYVNQQNEPTLFSYGVSHPQVNPDGGGSHGLRLNFRSPQGNIFENATVLTKSLGMITEPYLNLDYSVVFHFPDHPNDFNFVRFSIVNLFTGEDINQIAPICIKANDPSLNTVNGSDPNNTWKYSDWDCISFDLKDYVGKKSNLGLKIIASDCGESLHDTLLYLDNICLDEKDCEDSTPCLDGSISMNPISENCPEDPFTVSGNYILPNCDASDPTYIVLNLVPFNPNTGNSGTPTTITQGNFSNNSYSFNVDPSTLNLNDTLQYDLIAIANFSDGSSWSVSNPGKEITFINCEDRCEDYWVAILDEYIDGTQSGSNYVYLMANGNYPSGATYTWTTTRQNGQTQTYAGGDIILVDASINNRITSARVTVTYENCTETVRKRFACAIPNADANGNLFPECSNTGGGFGKATNDIKIYPNPAKPNNTIKIKGLESYDVDKFEVLDLFGNIQSIQKSKPNSLQLGNLKTGIYFVKISTKQGVIQKKIIVN